MSSDNEHPIVDPNQSQREAVRQGIAQFQQRLQAAGHDFRAPPTRAHLVLRARLQWLRVGKLRRRADVLVRGCRGFAGWIDKRQTRPASLRASVD